MCNLCCIVSLKQRPLEEIFFLKTDPLRGLIVTFQKQNKILVLNSTNNIFPKQMRRQQRYTAAS